MRANVGCDKFCTACYGIVQLQAIGSNMAIHVMCTHHLRGLRFILGVCFQLSVCLQKQSRREDRRSFSFWTAKFQIRILF
ncbi:unnamed protein product [Onchocerca flexuosa]|uniref:Secreted protein n=1 Tax=Onchocerca flexuosa TaxID=387005 RepID=A0A183HNW6_9BILA|nr:unnamed protein product [Onchocerca flexuosa]